MTSPRGRAARPAVTAIAGKGGRCSLAALLARATEARRVIADCDQRLARYRAALEAGTDSKLVAQWTAEVTTTRAAAQAQLRDATGAKPTRMTPDEINTLIASLGNLLTSSATPTRRQCRNLPRPRTPAHLPTR